MWAMRPFGFAIHAALLAASLLPAPSAGQQPETTRLHNWMWTYEYAPAAIAHPRDEWELSQVVQDTRNYPSPLRAYGSLHSPSQCVVNEGGTVVNMTGGFKAIHGLSTDSRGRVVVSAQAGVTLLELHRWLGQHSREIPFLADIGDATIGSLAVSVSKDSNIGDPSLTGSFYKAVTALSYVDHVGRVVRLTDTDNATALATFKSSDGMLGIVTSVTVVTLPAQLVTATYRVIPTADMLEGFRNGTFVVDADHAISMMVTPNYTAVRTFTRASEGAKESPKELQELAHGVLRDAIAVGRMRVLTLDAKGAAIKAPVVNHYRSNFSSHYAPVVKGSIRGDGTWYEFPYERFEGTMRAFLAFWKSFKDRHDGFEPSSTAVFFVQRIPDKPFGWFSQQGAGFDKPGLSFNLDSLTDTPDDPRWEAFLRENNAFVQAQGGRFSLTQTRFMTRSAFLSAPGQQPLPDTPNSRFASAYFKQFLAHDPAAAAASSTKAANGQG